MRISAMSTSCFGDADHLNQSASDAGRMYDRLALAISQARELFAHGFACKLYAVCSVDEPVEYCVGDCGRGDRVEPA